MPRLSTISSKGQITVPLEVRRRLGVKEGDQVEFVFDGGNAILRPAQGKINPFEEYAGILHAFDGKQKSGKWAGYLRDDERDG